jgi:TetR/AcrR family transcriptional regulator, transcriptional repressor of bet genes
MAGTARMRIEDVRRAELIAAAHRVFLRHGLGGLTSARIGAEAGMSPGIIAYYFSGKDAVLLAMVRFNNRLLMEEVVARLRDARTGWERLLAIVEGNFPVEAFTPAIASAWLSVCAAAGAKPDYARLQHLFHRRLRSNLASAFDGGVEPRRLHELSVGLAAMIDGLWLRKGVGGEVSREDAVGLVLQHLQSSLGPEEMAALRSSTKRCAA